MNDGSARDSFSANHNSDRFNVSASQEITSATCDCACHHGSRDVIEALRSELRAAKQELARSREQLAMLRQTEAKLRQRYLSNVVVVSVVVVVVVKRTLNFCDLHLNQCRSGVTLGAMPSKSRILDHLMTRGGPLTCIILNFNIHCGA